MPLELDENPILRRPQTRLRQITIIELRDASSGLPDNEAIAISRRED
jgi:hypothetical protein